jgi:hypothetical protein
MMNEIELTQLFVQYATVSDQLATIKAEIEKEILERKDSVKIAGVQATYYKPTTGTPKYEEAAIEFIGRYPAAKDRLGEYQTTTISTKWKDFCAAMAIEAPPGEDRPARVVIK